MHIRIVCIYHNVLSLRTDLWRRCMTVVTMILEQESKGWYIKYKDRLIAELRGRYSISAYLLRVALLSVQNKGGAIFEKIRSTRDIAR